MDISSGWVGGGAGQSNYMDLSRELVARCHFFGTLASIAYLWRPDANTREYANLTAMLLNAPQDYEDDQVEAIAPSLSNDHELELSVVQPGDVEEEEEDRVEESHPTDNQDTTALGKNDSPTHEPNMQDDHAIV